MKETWRYKHEDIHVIIVIDKHANQYKILFCKKYMQNKLLLH